MLRIPGITLWKLLALITLAGALPAAATTWFVAPTGNDQHAGTIKQPFRTLTHAGEKAKPGDVVAVRAGTYREAVRISASGRASSYIVFRPYHDEKVVIDGEGFTGHKNLVTLDRTSYVELSGFEIRNSDGIGICGWNSRHIKISRNTVHNVARNGIYFGGDKRGIASDITVDGNTVFHTVLENRNHKMRGGWASALVISKCDDGAIVHNRVFENSGEGLGFLLTDHGRIEHNEVFDNFSVEVYLDNVRFIRVASNLIYSTGKRDYYRDGFPAAGIGTANESYEEANPLSDLVIVDNVVVNSRWGFYYGAYDNGGGLKNTVVANNTFSRSQIPVRIDKDAHSGDVIENNTIDRSPGEATKNGEHGGVVFRNNGWREKPGSGSGQPENQFSAENKPPGSR